MIHITLQLVPASSGKLVRNKLADAWNGTSYSVPQVAQFISAALAAATATIDENAERIKWGGRLDSMTLWRDESEIELLTVQLCVQRKNASADFLNAVVAIVTMFDLVALTDVGLHRLPLPLTVDVLRFLVDISK